MTSDNLLKFLGNREYLHQVSYQELKSMVVQYPYSLSLRYLLAMKSQQEDNTDLDRNIELLATYGIDRSHLHRIFSEDPIVLEDLEESIIMGEDFLELKELSALERDLGEELAVNEVNNLNFLQEKQVPIPQEIPLSEPEVELPPTPSISEEITLEATTDALEEIAPALGAAALVTSLATDTIEPLVEEIEIPVEEVAPIVAPSTLETEINKELPENPIIIEDTPIPIEATDNLPSEETVNSIEEEEFITLDFEEELSGIATIENEAAPSASFVTKEVTEVPEVLGGLPEDAVEVNDLYASKNEPVLDKDLVASLFEGAEAVAEPAASDSVAFIENPEALLVTESEVIEEATTSNEEVDDLVETAIVEAAEKTTEEKILPSIDFEVEYSESDPITFESIQEGTEIIPPEEPAELVESEEIAIPSNAVEAIETLAVPPTESKPEVVQQEASIPATILAAVEAPETVVEDSIVEEIAKKPVPKPAKATFKFSSLDRLAATFDQSAKATKPAPKAKFSSWQQQNSLAISPFSSTNLMPTINGKGKIIKRKRKVIPKTFEKTVAFAEESLAFDTALVSETLAQLLVRQGQYSKARTMYEQLCLIMPKKSSFFAGEIEKIQNLPDEDS